MTSENEQCNQRKSQLAAACLRRLRAVLHERLDSRRTPVAFSRGSIHAHGSADIYFVSKALVLPVNRPTNADSDAMRTIPEQRPQRVQMNPTRAIAASHDIRWPEDGPDLFPESGPTGREFRLVLSVVYKRSVGRRAIEWTGRGSLLTRELRR